MEVVSEELYALVGHGGVIIASLELILELSLEEKGLMLFNTYKPLLY